MSTLYHHPALPHAAPSGSNRLPWHEAPHWAKWAAMDRTGNWFWYEEEPKDEDGYFTLSTGRIAQFSHLPCPLHWRMSLQHRPATEGFFFSSAGFAHACLQS